MKSVFKIVLNKLRSTFRRSTDQNLDQQHEQHRESIQDDSEQSSKIKNSRSDSSLGTCSSSVLLGNHSKLSDLIENELKKKGGLSHKHQSVIRCSSATNSPRRPPIVHPPVKQYGSNKSTKSTKSTRSFGSTLSNKSVRSVGQLNEERATTSSVAGSTTNLQYQRKNVSCQNSNDTLSTTSSIALLFNAPQQQTTSSAYSKQFEQQLNQKLSQQQRANLGSNQSLLRGDSPDNSSSHLSSLGDTVPELPNINDETQQRIQQELTEDESSYSIKDYERGGELENAISISSPNLYMQQKQNQSQQTPYNQPLLISQSMSMEEPELSDTDSLIAVEIDQAKIRSKSVDASVVIAMKNQNLSATASGGQRGKPRGSTTFLEIPKWRLFVRKPSNASTSVMSASNTSGSNLGATGTTSNQESNVGTQENTNQITNQTTTTKTIIKLAEIFKDCIHCKLMDAVEPKKIYDSSAMVSNDLFSDSNNNTLTENQSIEEEDEEDFSDEPSSEEQDECAHASSQFNTMSSFFHGNDFSSTAVYHQQQGQHTSSMAKDSGVRRYVKNRQRRSSYNVTYFSKPPSNLQQQQQQSATRPLSATGFVKKSDDKPAPPQQNDEQSDKQSDKQPIFRLPSVTLSEASDDEQEKNAMNDLMNAASVFGTEETQFISIQITEPSASCYESELEDPGSGITVVSLEVPVLNSGKQARSASVDSSFLQVPQRTDIGVSGDPAPTKSMRSRSVDIALPEGPNGPYLVVPPAGNQRPPTTK